MVRPVDDVGALVAVPGSMLFAGQPFAITDTRVFASDGVYAWNAALMTFADVLWDDLNHRGDIREAYGQAATLRP